jgi:uroporphyrinogen decarboxylase
MKTLSPSTWPWKPDPDYRRLLDALRREGQPDRVPFLELFADPEIIAAFLGEPVTPAEDRYASREALTRRLDQKIRFWHILGYDALWQGPVLDFPDMLLLESQDTARLRRPVRSWVNEKAGAITSWADFERYSWPRPEQADLYPLEYMAERLPEGMGILAQISGVYEPVSWLMGYQTLSLCLYEAPDLVDAMFARVREIILPLARSLAQMDRVIGIWMGDDLGFKTGTLIAPRHLRQYVFPIQKEVADIAHTHGLPFILHSCGNLAAVMEDLIAGVGIQAKHSFEDVIQPVEAFVDQYGGRIAAIGGVDVDLLTSGTEQQVRQRTRQVLAACTPGRGYVLGSGNSVANYIPLENFLAMLDEGWRFNTGGN